MKRGKCLAILKPVSETVSDTTVTPQTILDQTAISTTRQRRNGRVLRTVGLARTFGAINLASFTVLSVGVTGIFAQPQYS